MKVKLSILIPIYNCHVTEFIHELHRQSLASGIDFEILGYDDASGEKFKTENRKISLLGNVRYVELEKNLGRSAIRNLLAREAAYENLLFFDCDSKITSPGFLKKYLDHISTEKVVFGGRCYQADPPGEKKKFLRWHYGVQRESTSAGLRRKKPYKFFMSNNFLISRKIFLSVLMNEEIKGYGHEDTVFAGELKRRGIEVEHIDNPLCHTGLEEAEEFLVKTRQGIANLKFLIQHGLIDEDVRVYRYYRFLRKMNLLFLIKLSFRVFERNIRNNLLSESPDLKYFDFYKLSLLAKEMDGN